MRHAYRPSGAGLSRSAAPIVGAPRAHPSRSVRSRDRQYLLSQVLAKISRISMSLAECSGKLRNDDRLLRFAAEGGGPFAGRRQRIADWSSRDRARIYP